METYRNLKFNFFDYPITISVKDGVIAAIDKADKTDNYASLGFCEIHTHGAMGCDFESADAEGLDKATRFYLQNGITAFCPTFTATPLDVLETRLNRLYGLQSNVKMLKSHLEGPFISVKRKGAQPQQNIRGTFEDEDVAFFEKNADKIGIVTLCPAVKNAEKLVETLIHNGIKAQAGHDDSNANEIKRCIAKGLDGVTHIYCGCSTTTRDKNFDKDIALTEAGLTYDNLYVEIIADGKHIGQDLLKFIIKNKPQDKVIFVSDSLSAAGMPKGYYLLGEQEVYSDTTVVYLKDMSALSGSVSNLAIMLKLAVANGIPLEKAIDYISTNPRRYMGLPTTLKLGDSADFNVLDEQGNLLKTVYKK